MNSANSIYGIRVTSGVNNGTDVTDFGHEFNQATSLVTYSNEIQLVNGFFQTKASSTDGYINYSSGGFHNPIGGSYTYPNYGTITSSGQLRYLTVQYYITTPGSYSFFSLNIIGATNFAQNPYTGVLLNNITLQYKIVNPLSATPINTNITTAWLNGNVHAVAGINNLTKNISGTPGFWFNPNIKGVTYESTSSNRYLQVTSGTGTGNAPFLVYIRIGVPMNHNIRWRQLSVSFL